MSHGVQRAYQSNVNQLLYKKMLYVPKKGKNKSFSAGHIQTAICYHLSRSLSQQRGITEEKWARKSTVRVRILLVVVAQMELIPSEPCHKGQLDRAAGYLQEGATSLTTCRFKPTYNEPRYRINKQEVKILRNYFTNSMHRTAEPEIIWCHSQ